MTPWWFWALVAFLALQRLAELAYSRYNERRLLSRGGRRIRGEVYLPLVTVHVAWFVGLVLEPLLAPWTGVGWWTLPALAVFLTGELIRYSSMWVLGDRWTTTIVVVPGEPPVQRGPYRLFDHPIYVGVVLVLVAVPVLVGLWLTAALATVLNLAVLRWRIQAEERALAEALSG